MATTTLETDNLDIRLAQSVPPTSVLDSLSDQFGDVVTQVNDVYAAIGGLMSAGGGVGISFDQYEPGEGLTYTSAPPLVAVIPPGLDITVPVFQGEVPAIPGLDLDIASMPEPSFSKPTISIPPPPDIDWPTFSTSPPAATPISIPDAPSVTLPDPPAFSEIVIPAPPSVSVPEFSGTAPSIDLTPPEHNFNWSESAYTTALMTAVKDRLEADVATGGSGYGATVEQRIYDREQSRRESEDEQTYLLAMEAVESRGWMLPPGEVMGSIIDLSDRMNKRREETSAKIVAQEKELAQRNTHLSISTAIELESILIAHHSAVQQRSFEAARFALEAALEIYKAKVDAYRAKAQAFGVAAKVYEAKIRAEIVKAELYKAHIEGLKVGVQAKALEVERYKGQLKGIAALVNMYRAEMEAGRVIAEIEKTRIEAYAARVEAYKAQIAVIQAQYEGYVAQVRGEALKADIVKADALAYKAHAKAYRTQAELELEEARAAVDRLRAQLIVYAADTKKYGFDVERIVGIGKADGRYDDALAQLQVLKARYDGAAKDLNARNYQARTTEQAGQSRAQAIASEAEQNAAVSRTEATAQTQRASRDAATAVNVARAASETWNFGDSWREGTAISKHWPQSWPVTDTRTTNATTVGYYDHYRKKA